MTEITPRYLSIAQAAAYSGIQRKTLYRMLRRGDLQGEQTPGGGQGPGHWRVDRESIDRYFADEQVLAIVGSLGL